MARARARRRTPARRTAAWTRRSSSARRRTKIRRRSSKSRSGNRAFAAVVMIVIGLAALNWLIERPALAIGIVAAIVVCGLATAALFLAAIRSRRRREEALTRSIAGVDALSGAEFEQWMAILMRRTAFTRVQVHGGAGDLGADIAARTPNGRRLIVQCKRYRVGRTVGSPDVQKLAGTALAIHDAEVAAIVTTSYFTQQAKNLATRLDISLIDRDALARWATDDVPPVALAHRTTPGMVPAPPSARPSPAERAHE